MNEVDKRKKQKNRLTTGRFAGIPHAVMESQNWKRLSASAVKLALELSYQYNSVNNGDLIIAYSILRDRGWRSQNTINAAIKELIHFNLVIKTRQGTMMKKPSLYALTWHPIDQNKGKMDLCQPTKVPPGTWKTTAPNYSRKDAPKLVKRIKR